MQTSPNFVVILLKRKEKPRSIEIVPNSYALDALRFNDRINWIYLINPI